MYFNYNQCYINVFQMNGWINGLTVYNVHVMFEISAKTIYERNNCIKTYERFIGINISSCNLFPNPINFFLSCNVYS